MEHQHIQNVMRVLMVGHAWAGGRSLLPESMTGKTSDRINATDIIRDFFQKHSGSV